MHPYVLPGLAPGIHVLTVWHQERRGWPGQAWLVPAMTNYLNRSSSDDDADHVRRRQIFLLDGSARRGAVFRRQQPALLGQYHPAIAPPVRQHAAVVDEVVTLLGGEDARMRFIERIEPRVVLVGQQI